MEGGITFEIGPLQFEVCQVIKFLNSLFTGHVAGWQYITEFEAETRSYPGERDSVMAFVYPRGWPREISVISCRLHRTLSGFSADSGEVRAHHLMMPNGDGSFAFRFDVASAEGFFQLSPKKGDVDSIELFARVTYRRHYI